MDYEVKLETLEYEAKEPYASRKYYIWYSKKKVTKIIGVYYTVQNMEAWNESKAKGFLEGNKDYVWEGSYKAYSWMIEQMKKRLVSYKGEYPIWLWVVKPDIRRGGLVNPKEKAILLQV